jgi:hypothetical protein
MFWWVGVGLIGIVIYGSWRAWNVRLTVDSKVIMVANPVRSYRIDCNAGGEFRLAVIPVFPYANGVQLVLSDRKINLFATGALDESDRKRLSDALTQLAADTSCVNSVPPTWNSRW